MVSKVNKLSISFTIKVRKQQTIQLIFDKIQNQFDKISKLNEKKFHWHLARLIYDILLAFARIINR